MRNGNKLVVAMTVPLTSWTMMRGQLAFLSHAGYDVVLVTSPGPLLAATVDRERVATRPVPMEREIRLVRDLRSAISLIRVYWQERPSISMVSTPKAGLLAGGAALVTRVPTRIYVLRGLRLETARGVGRIVLWLMEWISIRAAHHVLVVSPSLHARARQLRLLGDGHGVVLGHGASNGVDLDRFAPSPKRKDDAATLRHDLGIPGTAFVFGFVGRLTTDKGVRELADAFARLSRLDATVWLLMVGEEEGSGLPPRVRAQLSANERVKYTGWLADPAAAYHMIDALVLPTYREGMPNACLEAAAAAKPVITTTATGAVDSIVNKVTGLLVPPRDADSLLRAMNTLRSDRDSAIRMGEAGRLFVEEHFGNGVVWSNMLAFLRAVSYPPV